MLRVPSAVVPDEHDSLVNPNHGDLAKPRARPPIPVVFDVRLFGK